VSAVGIPANPGTEIDEVRKRSYLAATIEADRKAEEQRKADEEAEQLRIQQEEEQRRMRLRRRARALSMM
jgi:hypothetical protein